MQPRQTKFRKRFKVRVKGNTIAGSSVDKGEFALKAIEPGRATARQLEAGRRVISPFVKKRGGKLHVRTFPDHPVSKKPLEVRQGSGKGSVELYVAPIHPGRIIYEVEGLSEEQAREAFKLAAAKLPFKTKFILRTIL